MRIGLCLSGGGVRATVFHLGVLERLAAQELMERVHGLSTVSGGSLAAGLVFTLADLEWPGSAGYRAQVVPEARDLLTRRHLQSAYLRRCLRPWHLVSGRASVLACALEDLWGVQAELRDLPKRPLWQINATTYETGKNWRFDRWKMGDYKTGYVRRPRFPVARAMAASAAVPGMIGPLVLRARDYDWYEKNWTTGEETSIPPKFKRIHLWDGGVYENLGLEALYQPDRGYRSGVDFLLVSDASATAKVNPSRFKAPYRLVEVAMDQVRGLRSRMIVTHFESHKESGSLLRLGNTARYIFDNAGAEPPSHWDPNAAMSADTIKEIREFDTTLRRLSIVEFDLLFRHGYEIADITLTAYCPSQFDHIPYAAHGELAAEREGHIAA